MSWFVTPEVVRLSLPEGQWIDVKKKINVGEQREMYARIYPAAAAGEKLKLDVMQVGVAKVLAYLVAWSLTDAAGKPVAVDEAAINNLHPDKFKHIREAVDAHEAAIDSARGEEKNAPDGVSA